MRGGAGDRLDGVGAVDPGGGGNAGELGIEYGLRPMPVYGGALGPYRASDTGERALGVDERPGGRATEERIEGDLLAAPIDARALPR
ncbi:MAG TPA: hypothetical protein VG388_10970 [Solirubrobacteraceae bacterium]|nr:hypothetical protein [Solirubrobacteraceae bacterium]